MTVSQRSGFTLLELIVVLAVISVLLTLGVSGYGQLRQRLALASATRQVATDLALARIRAISRNREQRLLFALGTASYRTQEKNGERFEDVDSMRALPAGIHIDECTAPDNAVSFRPRGGAGSFGKIVFTNTAGESRSVTVGITGRARIQ